MIGYDALTSPSRCRAMYLIVRHVDDALCISRAWCAECLANLVHTIHGDIPFCVEASSATCAAVLWLDVVLYVSS